MVYSFLPNKEMKTYEKIFSMILDHVKPPETLNCDFEKAIHCAASKILRTAVYMAVFFILVRIGGSERGS